MEISKRIQNDIKKKDHTALRRKDKENENDKNKEDERGMRNGRRKKKEEKGCLYNVASKPTPMYNPIQTKDSHHNSR